MPVTEPIDQNTQRQQLNAPPPRPPRDKQNIMQMSAGPQDTTQIDMSSPAIQIMSAMGDARNALLKLAALVPPLAGGVQQIVSGLEQVVPQMVADVVAGNPPGSSGAGMGGGAPQAAAAPTAPQVQAGMP